MTLALKISRHAKLRSAARWFFHSQRMRVVSHVTDRLLIVTCGDWMLTELLNSKRWNGKQSKTEVSVKIRRMSCHIYSSMQWTAIQWERMSLPNWVFRRHRSFQRGWARGVALRVKWWRRLLTNLFGSLMSTASAVPKGHSSRPFSYYWQLIRNSQMNLSIIHVNEIRVRSRRLTFSVNFGCQFLAVKVL